MAPIKTKIANGPTRQRLFRALYDPFPLEDDPMTPAYEERIGGNLKLLRRCVEFSFVHPRTRVNQRVFVHIKGISWVGMLVNSEVEVEGWIVDAGTEWNYLVFSATYNLLTSTGDVTLTGKLIVFD